MLNDPLQALAPESTPLSAKPPRLLQRGCTDQPWRVSTGCACVRWRSAAGQGAARVARPLGVLAQVRRGRRGPRGASVCLSYPIQ
jgi:hypothetical protein